MEGSLTFCEGEQIKLSVPQNSNYSYEWKIGGAPITGASLSSYDATLTGDYTVNVTNVPSLVAN